MNEEKIREKRYAAILLAAGSGRRMGGAVPKQFMQLGSFPVLYYALKSLQEYEKIREIILVASEDSIAYCREEIIEKYHFTKVTGVVQGGKERYDSVYAGLCACRDADFVLIHDSARPFLSKDILDRVTEGVLETGGCIVGVPSKDTVKLVDEDGYVKMTPDRKLVWNVQTPQAFSYSVLRSAYEKLRRDGMEGITDDAMVVERALGMKVRMVLGSYENIKVTTPENFLLANSLLTQIFKKSC